MVRVRDCRRKGSGFSSRNLHFVFCAYLDKKLKHSSKKKNPTRSLVRLKFLQKYCNQLLSCDPRVSQSADLVQFFHPKGQDLEPEFSKNRQVT